MYPLPSGRSVLVRRIHRVSIDTIRLSSDLLGRFNSASIASKTPSTSRIEAHPSAEPRAISIVRFLAEALFAIALCNAQGNGLGGTQPLISCWAIDVKKSLAMR